MNAPPRLAVLTLRRISSVGVRAEIEGDLHEAFLRWAETRGLSFARRRYWREVAMLAGWRVLGVWRRFLDNRKRGGRIEGRSGGEIPRRGNGQDRNGKGPPRAGLRDFLIDTRYGLRRLAKNPVSSGVAILLLAVGIGGNTMVYTAVDALLLEPPPAIEAPEDLVGIDWVLGGNLGTSFGYYDYEFYRDQGAAFEDVLAYGGFTGGQGRRTDQGGGEVVVGQGTDIQQAGAWVVSGNYFRILGTPMGLGPGFSPEVQDGAELVAEVILSHGYWQRGFGGDPTVLEQPIYLNGAPFRVAGVTHPEFRGVNPGEPVPDLFLPILSAEIISRGYSESLRRFHDDGSPSASRFLRLIARLEPGVTVEGAQAEALILQARWDEEFSSWSEEVYGDTYQVRVRSDFSMPPFESRLLKRQLYFLWFVVGAVFLIACTNLAILLLAAASGREREMGIRASLGAGRRRLLGQLVTESLVLSALGGAVGLSITFLAADLISATVSANISSSLKPDTSVALFALLLATSAAVLFGTVPAWNLSRTDVTTLLHRPGQARTRAIFRGGLVATQTALSILLLIVGGLMIRSIQGIQRIDLGFDPDRRLAMSIQLENAGYSEEDGQAFVTATLDRLRQVPGVRFATTCNRLPFLGSNTWTFTAPGTDFSVDGLQSRFNLAGPDYFEAIDIPIVAGRAFTRDDGPGTPWVAVVNEVFAQRFWPEESPLGKTLDFADQSVMVVGVAETAVYNGVRESPSPFLYFPSLQFYQGRQNFIVATEPAIAAMVRPVDQAIREMNADLTIVPIDLAELVDSQTTSYRIWGVLIGVMAGVALLLALVGLYGVQSYLVARRTRELGIRLALGQDAGSLLAGVLKSGLAMSGMGVVIGLLAALGLTRFMQGFLVGVAPTDPLVFVSVPLLLLLASTAACLVPAYRASRVDPVEALAQE